MSKSVPKLRFKGFSGEWERKKLIDTADKKIKWSFIGGPFGSNLKASDYIPKGIRVIQLQNIGDSIFHNKYEIYTSEKKADELLSNNIYPNEIILSKMGDPVARACLIPNTSSRYVMCSDGIRLVVDEKKFNKFFIYTYINSKIFRTLAEHIASGSTRKRIGLGDLKKLPLFIPKKKQEQQKIANCLSSLDNLIEAQNKKVETLKKHKKGMMQQLFPKEGEKEPELRFKEFSGEWEVPSMKNTNLEIIDGDRGNNYPKSNDFTNDGFCLFLSAKNITKNGFKLEEKQFITKEKDNLLRKGKLQDLDIIITTRGSVGHIAYNKNIQYKNIRINSGMVILRNNSNHINQKYIYKLFSSNIIQKQIDNIAFGSAQPQLTVKDINNLEIPLPKPPEQQKIANCLSSLDNLIEAQNKKIKTLTKHKKGLMQQLFVSNEGSA